MKRRGANFESRDAASRRGGGRDRAGEAVLAVGDVATRVGDVSSLPARTGRDHLESRVGMRLKKMWQS